MIEIGPLAGCEFIVGANPPHQPAVVELSRTTSSPATGIVPPEQLAPTPQLPKGFGLGGAWQQGDFRFRIPSPRRGIRRVELTFSQI